MCLLDTILSYDRHTIHGLSSTHRDPSNPLARAGRLDAVCGIEYAAQAMAFHGSITGDPSEGPRIGYLASVRDLLLQVARLDDLSDDLGITATLLASAHNGASYAFSIVHANRTIISGRATILFGASIK